MNHEKDQPNARREFLKTTVAAGAGAAVTAVLPAAAIASPDGQDSSPAKPRPRYQESEHILDYYRTARL